MDELANLDGCVAFNEGKTKTKINELMELIYKHKRLTFDSMLVRHMGMPPKLLNTYVNCLEKYKFIKTYMDPSRGMTIDWVDSSDLVKYNHPSFHMRRELNIRKRFS